MATHTQSCYDSSVGAEKAREARAAELTTSDRVLKGVAWIGAGLAIVTMPQVCGGIAIATGLIKLAGVAADELF